MKKNKQKNTMFQLNLYKLQLGFFCDFGVCSLERIRFILSPCLLKVRAGPQVAITLDDAVFRCQFYH